MVLQMKLQVKEAVWENCLVTWLPVLFTHLGILFFSGKLDSLDPLQIKFC